MLFLFCYVTTIGSLLWQKLIITCSEHSIAFNFDKFSMFYGQFVLCIGPAFMTKFFDASGQPGQVQREYEKLAHITASMQNSCFPQNLVWHNKLCFILPVWLPVYCIISLFIFPSFSVFLCSSFYLVPLSISFTSCFVFSQIYYMSRKQ